jgi:Domain of unknown function (DUF4266)
MHSILLRPFLSRLSSAFAAAALLVAAVALGGCVTVRPQEHATLADPTMRFDDDARARGQMEHALDNREAAYGGNGVAGGGCGCN